MAALPPPFPMPGPAGRNAVRLLGSLVVVLLACESSSTSPRLAVRFEFALHHFGAEERFVAETTDPNVIARARAQLARPRAERDLFVEGALARGNGGHNSPWSWHLVPGDWDLAESSIELCDSTPTLLEADLDYWFARVGRFCPWDSYVAAEL